MKMIGERRGLVAFVRMHIASVILAAFTAVGAATAMATEEGCTPGARQAVVTVIDAGLAACVAANADLQDADLQKACGFAEDVWPLVRRIVEGSRKGAAKMGCGGPAKPPSVPDAGH